MDAKFLVLDMIFDFLGMNFVLLDTIFDFSSAELLFFGYDFLVFGNGIITSSISSPSFVPIYNSKKWNYQKSNILSVCENFQIRPYELFPKFNQKIENYKISIKIK